MSVGDEMGKGQECTMVEAMKMENSLDSGVTGVVKAFNLKQGDTVDEEQGCRK